MTTTATVRPNDPAHPTDPDGTAGSTSPARPISPARPTDPSASARPASPARLARRPRRWPRFLTITDALSPRILADPGAWVGALLRHARLPFAAASILNLLSYLVVGLIPAVLGAVVDTGLAHGLTARLLPGLAILAGLGLLGAVVGSLAEMFSMGAWPAATSYPPSPPTPTPSANSCTSFPPPSPPSSPPSSSARSWCAWTSGWACSSCWAFRSS